jgi:hypothetical protein
MESFTYKGLIKDEDDFNVAIWGNAVKTTSADYVPLPDAEQRLWLKRLYEAIQTNEVVEGEAAAEPWTKGKYPDRAVEVAAWQILVYISYTPHCHILTDV